MKLIVTQAGRLWPWSTLGTTSTATLDPVDAIADVCAHHDVWLHVDAGHGGGLRRAGVPLAAPVIIVIEG